MYKMIFSTLMAAALLAGCSTVETLRQKEPAFTKSTASSQSAVSSCVAQALSAKINSAYLNYLPGPNKSTLIFQVEYFALWETTFLKKGSGSKIEVRIVDGTWESPKTHAYHDVYRNLKQAIDQCS